VTTSAADAAHTGDMNIWVTVAIVAGVVLVAALVVAWRRKDDRADRRELRKLRWQESNPDTYGAAELRRNMWMTHVPGKGTLPGGP